MQPPEYLHERLRQLALEDPREARRSFLQLLDSGGPALDDFLGRISAAADGRLRHLVASALRNHRDRERLAPHLIAWHEIETDEFTRRAIAAALERLETRPAAQTTLALEVARLTAAIGREQAQRERLNRELIKLYREHKVNPVGGCLPMLLQMPLFFALYSVLFNAIELRQAAFVAWIHDLSAPDKLFEIAGFPIRLLPVLMALSGLLTQKLTPTDPRQASTMYLMNAVMVVFFYNLPSGLVLYWTVMNLLTALQQWLALREDGSPAAAAVEVEGPTPGARRAGGGQKVARRASRK